MKNYSAQRQLVLKSIKSVCTHPTAKDVYMMCKKVNSSIGFATVYRNLKELEKEGQIIKVVGPFGAERFDGNVEMHNHIVCPICGKIHDIDCGDDLKILLEKEMQDNDYLKCGLSFYKECQDCINK